MSDTDRATELCANMAMLRQTSVQGLHQLRNQTSRLLDWRSQLRIRLIPWMTTPMVTSLGVFVFLRLLRGMRSANNLPQPQSHICGIDAQQDSRGPHWLQSLAARGTQIAVGYLIPWLINQSFTRLNKHEDL